MWCVLPSGAPWCRIDLGLEFSQGLSGSRRADLDGRTITVQPGDAALIHRHPSGGRIPEETQPSETANAVGPVGRACSGFDHEVQEEIRYQW